MGGGATGGQREEEKDEGPTWEWKGYRREAEGFIHVMSTHPIFTLEQVFGFCFVLFCLLTKVLVVLKSLYDIMLGISIMI